MSQATPGTDAALPLVSLVLPAYNEAAILGPNLTVLRDFMRGLEDRYRWEMVIVNDGSRDETGAIAEAFARACPNARVLHHKVNFGLGQALRYGFSQTRGDCVVVMDVDLSYTPDHIASMLDKLRQSHAKVVLASPYYEGGVIANVPWLRKVLSVWANRFLSLFARDRFHQLVARGSLSTLTGMVRAYDGPFIRSLNLRAMSMEINPEIVYKAMLLRARIDEVPARLDWERQAQKGVKRRSSMKMAQHTVSVLLSGFVFRPFMFFVLPGLAFLLFSAYCDTWMLIHFTRAWARYSQFSWPLSRASAAAAEAFRQFPHTFVLGLLSLMLAIQLLGLGVMAMQAKKYFEELFHLASSIHRRGHEPDGRGTA
jgi:glycosyltransferase involved in cell wall biosynthesis